MSAGLFSKSEKEEPNGDYGKECGTTVFPWKRPSPVQSSGALRMAPSKALSRLDGADKN